MDAAAGTRSGPATDTALMLGLAHTLVTEGLHDQRVPGPLLRRLPDVRARTSLDDAAKDAALGRAGSPGSRTPTIVALARRMAAQRTLVTVTWSLQRAEHGEQPVWAGIALAAMLGQIGLPGGGFGHGYGSMGDVGDTGPAIRLPTLPQGRNPVADVHPGRPDRRPAAAPRRRPTTTTATPAATRTSRLVYWAGGNPFHHHQDLNRLRRAFARPDTVVVHEPFWTATARHADIVLPVTTALERDDLGAGRRDTHLIAMHRVVEPAGEARDDYAIFAGAGRAARRRSGVHRGAHRRGSGWSTSTSDIGAPSSRVPPFEEFWAAGELRLPPGPAHHTLFADFRADPDAHPLRTPSGRIEITSAVVAGFGYDDCPGHPRGWTPIRRETAAAR